jgi:hypothetical protein
MVPDWLVVDCLCLAAFFLRSPLLPDEEEGLLPVPDEADDLSPAPLGVSAPVPPGAMTSALEDPACGCLAVAPVPCAGAIEDTDAANTNNIDRVVVFKVMSHS